MDIQLDEGVHLVHIKDAKAQEGCLELVQDIDIGGLGERGCRVERVECFFDAFLGVVEVQDEEILAQFPKFRCGTVETGQSLNGKHTIQGLVDIHGGQLGLVEAGNVFVGHHEDAILVFIEFFGRLGIREAVNLGFCIIAPANILGTGEGDENVVGQFLLLLQLTQCHVV